MSLHVTHGYMFVMCKQNVEHVGKIDFSYCEDGSFFKLLQLLVKYLTSVSTCN